MTAGRVPVTMDLRRRLLDVQYGRAEDPHGWVVRVPRSI